MRIVSQRSMMPKAETRGNAVKPFKTTALFKEVAIQTNDVTSIRVVAAKEQQRAHASTRTDGGFDAYAYLAAACVIELLVWALPFSYGIFLDFYKSNIFRGSSAGVLSLIGTLSTGILYLSSPVILPIITRYPNLIKPLMLLGLLICCGSLLGAAFSTQVWHFVLSQGVGYSIGASLLYFPCIPGLFEWFPTRKGWANGILFSATGLGGLGIPFILEPLLDRFGHPTTFIGLAIGYALLVIPCFGFIKQRPTKQDGPTSVVCLDFLRSGTFWVLLISDFLQGVATFLPAFYLPVFAEDIGLNTFMQTLTPALTNGASIGGCIVLGWASDRNLPLAILLSAIGSSSAVFLLWGFATNLPLLIVFCLCYGFCAGGFSSMWPNYATTATAHRPGLATIAYSIFVAARGIANIVSSPVSGVLLQHSPLKNLTHTAYGVNNFGLLILFTGTMMLLSSVGALCRILSRPARQISFLDF